MSFCRLFVLLPLFMIMSWSAVATEKILIRLSDFSSVRAGADIKVSDLITEQISDRDLWTQLRELKIGDAPASGKTSLLRNADIVKALRSKLSFADLQRVQFKIPEMVRVRAVRNYISAQEVKFSIDQLIQSFCQQCETRYDEFKLPEVTGSAELLGFRLGSQGLNSAGYFKLPLTLDTSFGTETRWVTGRLALSRTLPVAKRLIRAGEVIKEDDFLYKSVSVQFAKDQIPAANDLIGLKSIRPIGLGQTIVLNDLVKTPIIKRGQTVRALVGATDLEISVMAEASQDGAIGDQIRLQLRDSKKMVNGVIESSEAVRIQ